MITQNKKVCFISRKYQLWFSVFVLGFLLVGSGASYALTDDQKRLEELKQTIDKLKKELKATTSDRDEVNQELENTEKDIGELSKKAREIKETLKERQQRLDTLKDEKSQLNSKKKQQEQLVAAHINAAYRLGGQGNFRLLLNQEDPSRVDRNLRYYDYFLTARAEKISEYMSTIQSIDNIEPKIRRERDLIQSDFDRLKQQESQLETTQERRKLTLAKLNAKITNTNQSLNTLIEDRRNLERLLNKVIENIADVTLHDEATPFAELKGKLPWPTRGKVLKRFGAQRVTNKMRWEGLLIASDEGNPVRAVHYGRVIFSDYLRGHGLLIIVDHGSDFLSLYAHNQALYKTLGEWVDSGEIIASVGNSGGQQKTALYFELRYKGKPTNPQKWFRRA